MHINKTWVTLATCLCIAALSMPARADDHGASEDTSVLRPVEIEWKETAEFPGLKIAILHGDPSKPGPYVMRAKFEPGFMTKPHHHTAERFVTVISGIWWAVTGDEETPETTIALSAGSSMVHAAGEMHFDGARQTGAIVQIVGNGPVSTIYPEVADD